MGMQERDWYKEETKRKAAFYARKKTPTRSHVLNWLKTLWTTLTLCAGVYCVFRFIAWLLTVKF